MEEFDDIEQFRKTDEAQLFAEQWLQEQRTDKKSGEKHMDLLVWEKYHPHQALGIILSLLEKVQDHKKQGDDDIHEIIAGLLVDEMVEFPPDDFVPVLIEAVAKIIAGSIFHRKWGDTVLARTGTTRPMSSILVSVARRLAATCAWRLLTDMEASIVRVRVSIQCVVSFLLSLVKAHERAGLGV